MLLVQVEWVLSWGAGHLVQEVLVFLGFSNSHRHLIQNVSAVAALLTKLTKEDLQQFVLGPRQQYVFEFMNKLFPTAVIV